jgi:actin-like ATPase involved in cell morphogenesis
MCKLLGLHKTRTTSLRPQSDGMVEKFNATIENMLASFISENQKD